MSYCRWSSDNFKCDLYCYKSDYGYEIHIANNRIVDDLPKVDMTLITKQNSTNADKREFIRQNEARNKALEQAKKKKIGLKYDGKSFTCRTLEEFKEKLIELRQIGYNFPDYVFQAIEFEMRIKK